MKTKNVIALENDQTPGIGLRTEFPISGPAESRHPVRDWAKAVRDNDLNALISHYAPFGISPAVFSKHLQILEKAGLIAQKQCGVNS